MKIGKRTICSLVLAAGLMFPDLGRADTTLEFLVRESPSVPAKVQTVAIKDGRMAARGAGGDRALDLLFSRAEGNLKVIDHNRRTVMTVDVAQVERLNRQTAGVQPLLRGLGEQIAKLAPEERRQWQELVGGGISLDRIAEGQGQPEPTRLVPTGQRTVAGIRCQSLQVVQGATAMAELCLAGSAALKVPAQDYATIRALVTLYQQVAAKGEGLARQLGLALPSFTIGEELGVPIAARDLSRPDQGAVTLRQVRTAPISSDLLRIPDGYQAKPLTLW